jgi:hypothetical protein
MVLVGFIALSLAGSSASLGATAAIAPPEPRFRPLVADSSAPIPESTPSSTSPGAATTSSSASSSGTHWYGYQLIISDAISIFVASIGGVWGLIGATTCTEGPSCSFYPVAVTFVSIGAAGFGLVPPLIHLLHHQYAAAAWSFGLRVVVPVVSGLALQNWSGMGGLLAIELLAAMVIDDAFLSSEPQSSESTQVEPSKATAETSRGALGLAYGGSF